MTLRVALFLSTAIASASAAAAPAAPSGVDALYAEAESIVVVGARSDDGLQSTRSATKTPTPLVDIPQTVSVISKDLIDDQAMRSLADVVRYAPGVVMGQGEGHRDQVTIRGSNSTADFFVDGVRDDIQYYRGLYNLDRVEVLKGPNALIFGRGGGGGVINRVLKRPEKDDFAAAAVAVDTFGGRRVEADGNKALGDAAGRLNVVYEQGRNWRDLFKLERAAVNPTLRWNVGSSTRIDASYEYAFDDRIVDRGVPSENGRPVAGFRDAYFGAPDANVARFNGHFAGADLVHEVSRDLEVNAKLVYGNFDKSYANVFPATAVTLGPGGAREVGIEAYVDAFERRNFFAQGNLIWKVETGPARHLLLLGAEFGDQRTDNSRRNGFFDSGVATTLGGRRTIVPFVSPFVAPPATFRTGPGERRVFSDAEAVSFYAQDQIRLGAHVEIIAGVRHDGFTLEVDNLLTGLSFRRHDAVWSPRAGLVLKPAPNASVYGSFSRSFLPQSGDQFVSLDATLEALAPERFENVEVGAKWDVTKALALAVAAYRLDRENTRAPGPTPGSVVLTGAQRSRGLEFSAVGALSKRWTVLAGATLQKSTITATTAAAPAGREAAQTPRRLFSLWTRYDATERLAFGVGVQRQGASFASISNAVVLPAFTRVDAALYWRLERRLEAQINVDNILNTDYFPTAHNDNNISTGAPRSAIFTLRARF